MSENSSLKRGFAVIYVSLLIDIYQDHLHSVWIFLSRDSEESIFVLPFIHTLITSLTYTGILCCSVHVRILTPTPQIHVLRW